jgi:hypothetical protein
MISQNETETPTVAEDSNPARKAWVKPAYQKFSVSGSETANTSSNFDGTNYSS